MLSHEVLVLCESLFSYRPNFVHQIELQMHEIIVPSCIIIVHLVACESDLSWDNCLAPVSQPKQCLPYGCSGCCSIRPQYAWQLFRPYTLCPFEPSLDDFKQGLIRDLNLPVGLRVGGREQWFLIPNCKQKSLKESLSNCFPLSETKTLRIPYMQTMFFQTKLLTFFSVMEAKTSGSTHLVKQSMPTIRNFSCRIVIENGPMMFSPH